MTGSALSTGGGFCWFRWFCWCLLQGGVVFCAVAWTDFCGLLRSACQQVAKRDPECGAASLCALMKGHAKSGLKCTHWPPNSKPIIDEYRARGLNNGDGMLRPVDQSVIAEAERLLGFSIPESLRPIYDLFGGQEYINPGTENMGVRALHWPGESTLPGHPGSPGCGSGSRKNHGQATGCFLPRRVGGSTTDWLRLSVGQRLRQQLCLRFNRRTVWPSQDCAASDGTRWHEATLRGVHATVSQQVCFVRLACLRCR